MFFVHYFIKPLYCFPFYPRALLDSLKWSQNSNLLQLWQIVQAEKLCIWRTDGHADRNQYVTGHKLHTRNLYLGSTRVESEGVGKTVVKMSGQLLYHWERLKLFREVFPRTKIQIIEHKTKITRTQTILQGEYWGSNKVTKVTYIQMKDQSYGGQ